VDSSVGGATECFRVAFIGTVSLFKDSSSTDLQKMMVHTRRKKRNNRGIGIQRVMAQDTNYKEKEKE
jgi:predicted membrane protein